MFELLFGGTEGKIRWESFRIAPYGLVQRTCRHPVQVCQVGIHHNLLPPDHMDQGFNQPCRNSLFAGIRFLCHTLLCSQSSHSRTLVTGKYSSSLNCLSSTTSASLSPSPSFLPHCRLQWQSAQFSQLFESFLGRYARTRVVDCRVK